MGIKNFTILLNAFNYTSNVLTEYDSIFIDIQSYLYKAISNSFKEKENELKKDICLKVVKDLSEIFYNIFKSGHFKDFLKIFICFDGNGVPFKLPTQQARRAAIITEGKSLNMGNGKNLIKALLIGHNILSAQVYTYIVQSLRTNCSEFFLNLNEIKMPSKLQFIIAGSNISGEGEQKMFHFASIFKCLKPLLVSVDNDVFIISLLQIYKFDTVQIYKSTKVIYNLNIFLSKHLRCTKECFIYTSFLFGNDFIPAVIELSETNCLVICEALNMCEKNDIPHVFFTIIKYLEKQSKIDYKSPPQIEQNIILEYWKNILWVLDYYTKPNFKQKYMKNVLFNIFQRDQIIGVLLDLAYSKLTFNMACLEYKSLKTKPLDIDLKKFIFTTEQLQMYAHFFPKLPTQEMYNFFEINVT